MLLQTTCRSSQFFSVPRYPVSTVCCCLVCLVKNKWCCSVKSCNLWKHCLVKPSKFIPFSDVRATLCLVCIAGGLGCGVFRKVKTRRQVGLVPLPSSPSFALGSALARPCLLTNNTLRKTHRTAWQHYACPRGLFVCLTKTTLLRILESKRKSEGKLGIAIR